MHEVRTRLKRSRAALELIGGRQVASGVRKDGPAAARPGAAAGAAARHGRPGAHVSHPRHAGCRASCRRACSSGCATWASSCGASWTRRRWRRSCAARPARCAGCAGGCASGPVERGRRAIGEGDHAHVPRRPGARWPTSTPTPRPSGSTNGASGSRLLSNELQDHRPRGARAGDALAPKVEKLGEILGQVHDLDCAAATAERHPRWFGSDADCEAVRALVAEHRVVLEREAFALATGVFAGRARDVRELVETGWTDVAQARTAGRRGR